MWGYHYAIGDGFSVHYTEYRWYMSAISGGSNVLKPKEKWLGLSQLFIVLWASSVEGCLLSSIYTVFMTVQIVV